MTTRRERATVLAVDDLPEYRRLYRRRLGDEYEVLTAKSGPAALDMLGDAVDVVLLDRSMSDMSGDDVLGRIREANHDCRVAKVTADEPDDDIIDRGFDAYLVRPFTTEELTQTVDRLLARSSYEAHLQELYTLCVKRAKARADGGVNGAKGDCDSISPETEAVASDEDVDSEADTGDVAAIEERIREVKGQVDETVSTFDTADYRASFRDLPRLE